MTASEASPDGSGATLDASPDGSGATLDASASEPELAVLNAVAQALNSAADVRQALEQTLGLVADLLGFRTGWVWLLDPDSGRFYKAAERELPPFLQEPVRMAGAHRCWCIDQFRAGELTARNVDVYECSRLRPASTSGSSGLRYHTSVPLFFQSKPLGIMNLTGPARRMPSHGELELLSTIADQVGIAIERARLAEDGARLARAEERTRLAREIHDTLAQGLAAIALYIESALNRLDSQPEQARERLERALAAARENLAEARQSVVSLRSTQPLAGKPLPEALRALGRSFTAETGVPVRVAAAGDLQLVPQVEAELFRIAQEALTNVRKHAHARHVEVELRRRGRSVRLVVHDDGRGLHAGRRQAQGHGLVGMRERAQLLGGRLQVASPASGGTTVTARVPSGEQTT